MHRIAVFSVVTTALAGLLASSCATGGGVASSLPSPDAAIVGFNPSSRGAEHALYSLDELASKQPAALRTAAIKHLGDKDPRVHYAAVYALAITVEPGQGTEQLAALLTSPNGDDRLLAAGSLSGIGDKRGLPVLIDALDQTVGLSYRSPPQRAFEFAQALLLNLTDQDFGLKAAQDAPSVAATKPAWRQWWAANQATLRFDLQQHRYVP